MPFRDGLPLDRVLKRLGPTDPRARARDLWKAIQNPTEPAEEDPSHRNGWRRFPIDGSHADAAAWVARALALALDHAHRRGVLHRDVKPANVLVTVAEGPQLFDFNLGDLDDDRPEHAHQAMQGGTLPYMAPEQLRAFLDPKCWDHVGPAADLYSLGLVLREMLTGQRPPAPPAQRPLPRLINELLDMRAARQVPTRALNPAVPSSLSAIVAKCLAHEVADRYPDAAALAEDLDRYLRRLPLRHAVNPDRKERAANWLRRNRIRIAAVSALIVALGVAQATLHVVKAANANAATARSEKERHDAEEFLRTLTPGAVERDPQVRRRLELVRAQFREYARVDPSDYGALLNLAYLALNFAEAGVSQGEAHRESLELYDRAIEALEARGDVEPRIRAEAYLNRGLLRLKDAQDRDITNPDEDTSALYRLAKSDLDRAVADRSSLPTFRRLRGLFLAAYAETNLGRAPLRHGDYTAAESHFGRAEALLDELSNGLESVLVRPDDSFHGDSPLLAIRNGVRDLYRQLAQQRAYYADSTASGD
jgi:tetratricopeptide (TPR) repeat protein